MRHLLEHSGFSEPEGWTDGDAEIVVASVIAEDFVSGIQTDAQRLGMKPYAATRGKTRVLRSCSAYLELEALPREHGSRRSIKFGIKSIDPKPRETKN
jgi:hypothetical protein